MQCRWAPLPVVAAGRRRVVRSPTTRPPATPGPGRCSSSASKFAEISPPSDDDAALFAAVAADPQASEDLLSVTRESSRTARNLEQSQVARLAFGDANDAIVIEASLLRALPAVEATPARAAFERAAGWNPGEQGSDWRLFVLRPTRIQAYRGYAEIEGRDVMKDGRWLA